MRKPLVALVVLFGAIGLGTAQDKPAAPPPLPQQPAPPEPGTPEQAADKVVAAVAAKDVTALRALAAKDDPDPWLVADELLVRGKADAAAAFAKAAPRVDVEKLPEFVASRKGKTSDADARKALAAAGAALAANNPPAALASVEATKTEDDSVVAVRLDHVRGLALRGSRRLPESAAAFGRAAAAAEALGWLAAAADDLREAGTSSLYSGDARAALAAWTRRIEIEQRRDRRAGIAQALGHLGVACRRLGDARQALEFYERALKLKEELGDRVETAKTLGNMGDLYLELGDAPKALDCQRRALAVFEDLRLRSDVAMCLISIGVIHYSLCDYPKALDFDERAVKAAEQIADARLVATAVGNLGVVHEALGAYTKALELQERASKMKEAVGDRAGLARTLSNVGNLHTALGDDAKALACHQGALKVMEEVGDRAGVAMVLGSIGSDYRRLGDTKKALESLERGLKVAEELGAHATVAASLANIGNVHSDLGDSARWLDFEERSLRVGEEIGDGYAQVVALSNIAKAHFAAGRPREAVAAARDSAVRMAGLVRGVGEEQGAGARGRFAGTFDVGVCASAHLGDAGSACFFLESGRAGSLLESLGSRGALGAVLLPGELRNADAAARARETAATKALRRAIQGGDLGAIAAAKKGLDAARAEVGDVVASIQREAKAVADVAYPTADSLDVIRGRLREGDALVLYGLTSTDAFALLVTAKDARIANLGSTASVDAACAALRLDDDRADPAASLDTLRKLVVDPLALDAKTTRILVSPAGALSYVPFATLLGDRGVAYVPSGTTYGLLTRDAAMKGDGVLALGDPDYGVKSEPQSAAVAVRGAMNLVRLPATGVEAKTVGDVVLLGKDATEQGLREALSKKPRWRGVHLACHGLVNPELPMFSSLALTPSGEDDGFLTALEVFRMKCPADLVVLSACETGKGRVYKAEGIVGLTRAFMFAGAPRVLVSLWKVDDEATRALMTKFYELWKPRDGRGVAAAAALREAQSSVRSQDKWKHPRYWAAWVLWGLPE